MDDVTSSSIRSSNTDSISAESALSSPTLQVIRRNGAVVAYHLDKISVAITKAFLAVEGNQSAASQRARPSSDFSQL